MPNRPATLHTDAAFCERVCRIAKENGWTVDHMHSHVGHSFAFEHADHGRVAGDIFKDPADGLANACKALLPHISHLIFS